MTAHEFVKIGVIAGVMAIVNAAPAVAGPIGFSVRADTGDSLYAIDLATGRGVDFGFIPFGAEGLAMVGGRLLAIDGHWGTTTHLWDVTPSGWVPRQWPNLGIGTPIGPTGPRLGLDADLALHPDGTLFNLQGSYSFDDPHSYLYAVDPTAGAASYRWAADVYADAFAIDATGQGYAVDGKVTDALYRVDIATGAFTRIGGLGLGDTLFHAGMAFDHTGALWLMTTGVSAAASRIYRIDPTTGQATFIAIVTVDIPGLGTFGKNGFQSLAIWPGEATLGPDGLQPIATPEPGTLALVGLGAMLLRRRR